MPLVGLVGSCKLEIARLGWLFDAVTVICFVRVLLSAVAVRVCVPVVVGVQLMVMVVFAPAARMFMVCVPMVVEPSCNVTWNRSAGPVPLLVIIIFMG